jgi:(p)ppGpp synthase/HD superfamily hydrolase
MAFSERFDDALVYAARLHRDQVRKGSGAPYITHLLAVASLVGEHADEDAAIAALLHDAIEDQGGPRVRAEIAERFGAHIAELVDHCTDTDRSPKPPWKARKEAYLARLAEPAAPHASLLITAADKLHNCRSIVADLRREGMAAFRKFSAAPDEVLWYYRSVARVLAGRQPQHPLVADLVRAVAELDALVAHLTDSM